MGPYTFASGEGHPILQQDCASCRILVWANGHTAGLTDGHLSALVVVQRSKFFGTKVLRSVADRTVFRDNWVTATPPADSAAFENLYNSNHGNVYNINRPGSLTIADANATGAVTFTSVEPDDDYHVIAMVSDTSGNPDAGATRVHVTSKATSGFTINLEAAPGVGKSVTVDWHVVR